MTDQRRGSADPLALSGVIPPNLTVFDDEEAVDYEATAAHAQFTVDHGCDAVFTLGTNGEFALLTPEERRRVVERVTDAVDDVPVLAGVGAPGTRQTVRYAEHAADAGADGLIVVTPFYFPLDEEGAVEHYRRVAAAVDCPVYVYQIPSHAGTTLSLSAFDRIAAIDGVAGLKHTSTDLAWLSKAAARNPELTYLAGANDLLFAGLQTGCAGVVSGLANAVPELVVDLYAAHEAGEVARARELQHVAYDLLSAMSAGPHMAGVKAALSLRDPDFPVGPLRSPLRSVDEDQLARIERALAEHGYA